MGTAVALLLVKCFGVKLCPALCNRRQMKNFALWKKPKPLFFAVLFDLCHPRHAQRRAHLSHCPLAIKPARLLLITTFARIPTVTAGVLGGDALGSRNYWLAALALGGTLLLSGLGILWYRKRLK